LKPRDLGTSGDPNARRLGDDVNFDQVVFTEFKYDGFICLKSRYFVNITYCLLALNRMATQ